MNAMDAGRRPLGQAGGGGEECRSEAPGNKAAFSRWRVSRVLHALFKSEPRGASRRLDGATGRAVKHSRSRDGRRLTVMQRPTEFCVPVKE